MSTPSPADLSANGLLSKLHPEDQSRLLPHVVAMELPAGHVLQEAGDDVVNTWFPCGSAMAAFCVNTGDGHAIEVGLVGREGAIGGIVSNGQIPAYATSKVMAPGRFLRIKTVALEQAKLESIALRHWFARYSDCLIAQIFQTAACNARHTIIQRTAKWLLSAMDRTQGSDFEMTQDQLADMLGVGRTFVTRTVGQLRDDKIISTRRGVFTVLDETALRARTCACTTAIEDHFDTVLHGIYPAS
jgi:CRP-like cAMP-binding protein